MGSRLGYVGKVIGELIDDIVVVIRRGNSCLNVTAIKMERI